MPVSVELSHNDLHFSLTVTIRKSMLPQVPFSFVYLLSSSLPTSVFVDPSLFKIFSFHNFNNNKSGIPLAMFL